MIFLHFIKEKDSHFFSILPGILRIETLFGVVVTNDEKHPLFVQILTNYASIKAITPSTP
jgi:hypothetical protein